MGKIGNRTSERDPVGEIHRLNEEKRNRYTFSIENLYVTCAVTGESMSREYFTRLRFTANSWHLTQSQLLTDGYSKNCCLINFVFKDHEMLVFCNIFDIKVLILVCLLVSNNSNCSTLFCRKKRNRK